MENIKTKADLKFVIEQLESKKARELALLKDEARSTFESLKPLNLIKSTFKDMTSSPDFKDNLLNATIGLTAGYLSKVIVVGTSHNPIKKLLGVLLQLGVSNAVAKNSDTIKSFGEILMNKLFTKKESNV